MKVSAKYQVDGIVGNDPGQPSLHNIQVKDGRMIATNSYTLARIPVESIEGEEFYVPGEVYKAARMAAKKVKQSSVEITKAGGWLAYGDVTVKVDSDLGKGYPDTEKLIEPTLNENAAFSVGINPDLLVKLARALGVESNKPVRLTFTQSGVDQTEIYIKSIIVDRDDDGDEIGLLMPAGLESQRPGGSNAIK